MGLGELFTRSTVYTAVDTETGQSGTWTIIDNLAPDWSRGEYQGGMSIPGAWRCAILLADLLGGVPWQAFRSRPGAVSERVTPTPSFLEQPAPPDPRVVTFSSMALDLIWHGNAVALIASRTPAGWPAAYLPVKAEDVEVKRIEAVDRAPLPVGSVGYRIGQRWFSSDDVVHVKGPCRPGALRGFGVLENHLNGALSLASEQDRQARQVGTAGVPSGVLTVEDTPDQPLKQDEADEIKAGWMQSQRTRTVAVLPTGTKFEALAWNPTETQLLEARQFSLHETALLFGLDPSWLGVSGDSMTYANIEQQATNLVKFSLAGHLQRFEQTFTLHMPRGTEAKANLDAILRGDTLTRYQAHQVGIAAGFLTVDEARALENRPPLTPAQVATAAPPAAPTPSTDTPDTEAQP
jgi:HK97 family phage portal protein